MKGRSESGPAGVIGAERLNADSAQKPERTLRT